MVAVHLSEEEKNENNNNKVVIIDARPASPVEWHCIEETIGIIHIVGIYGGSTIIIKSPNNRHEWIEHTKEQENA